MSPASSELARMAEGTVSILFTDVEGSTALRSQRGDDAAQRILQDIEALVREEVRRSGGREVKALGDGLMVAFASARKAILCAAAVQRAIASQAHRRRGANARVRIGINSGEVVEVENDLQGAAVNAAARIMAKAEGGQILVSSVVRELAGAVPEVTYVNRGRHRLKGFPESWQLFEVRLTESVFSEPLPESPYPLFGRDAEMTELIAWIDRASRGEATPALIEGEPGIGKTRLMEEVMTRAADEGFAVFRGACDDFAQTRAFGPLIDALALVPGSPDPDRAEIGDLLARDLHTDSQAEEAATGPDLGYRVTELLVGLIERLAGRQPVMLAIDDLQWADLASLRALRSLPRRSAHLPFALVETARPLPRPPDLARMLDVMASDGAPMMVLGPLPPEAGSRLGAEIIGAALGTSILEQLEGTGGNPLYLLELVKALQDEGSIEVTGERAEARATSLPPGLRLTILRRLSFLPEASLETLQPASILGSRFTLADLSVVTGRPAVELLPALQPAILAGVVGEAGEHLRFRHDLIREAVYEDLPAAVRKGLHAEAGRRLAAAGAPVGQVAEQMALGASPGDLEAAKWLQEAAREAVFFSPSLAIDLYQRALGLLPPSHPGRDELIAGMIMPMEWAGRAMEAAVLVREALRRGPAPEVEYVLRRGLAYSMLAQGRNADSLAEYEVVMKLSPVGVLGSSAEGSHAIDLANSAMARLGIGDLAGARPEADEALALAQAAGDDYATSLARLPRLLLSWAAGLPAEARNEADELMRLCNSSPSAHFANFWAHLFAAMTLIDGDQFDEAEQALQDGLRLVEEQGRGSQVPLYHLYLGFRRLLSGDWDDASVDLNAALGLIEAEQGRYVQLTHGLRAKIAIHRGDLAGAATDLEKADDDVVATGPQSGTDVAMIARALLMDAEGDTQNAFAVMETVWDVLSPLRYVLGFWQWKATELVRLALAVGDRERAQAVTQDAERIAKNAGGVPSADATALRCRGLLEGDTGILLRAVEAYRRSPRVFDGAQACEDAALALAGAGQKAEAKALFVEAIDVYDRVGATRDAARAAAAMRAAGIRRGAVGARKRPTSGWDSLTGTELRIIERVTQGLTNRQIAKQLFISPYTVEAHLRHIFTKLGAASRAEVAAEAGRRAS